MSIITGFVGTNVTETAGKTNVSNGHNMGWNLTGNTSIPTSDIDAASYSVALLFFLVVVMLATVFGNGLILVVFASSKRLQTPFNYYICNLALADFLVGIIAMPGFTIYNLFDGVWPAGHWFCSFWMYFDWHMTFESTITLAVVSLDRYWSVRWPVSYKRQSTTTKTISILFGTWVYMHLAFFPGYIYDRVVNVYQDMECFWDLSLNKRFCVEVAVLGYYVPLGVMIFCNCSIAASVMRRANMVEADFDKEKTAATGFEQLKRKESVASQARKKDRLRKQRQPLITLGIITSCATVCWAPWVIYFTVAPHYPTTLPDILVTVGYWMCYLNSTINPYLYLATSEEFRRCLRQLIGKSRNDGSDRTRGMSLAHVTSVHQDVTEMVPARRAKRLVSFAIERQSSNGFSD